MNKEDEPRMLFITIMIGMIISAGVVGFVSGLYLGEWKNQEQVFEHVYDYKDDKDVSDQYLMGWHDCARFFLKELQEPVNTTNLVVVR